MNSELPFLQLEVGAMLGSTADLTYSELGLYQHIIYLQWTMGPVPIKRLQRAWNNKASGDLSEALAGICEVIPDVEVSADTVEILWVNNLKESARAKREHRAAAARASNEVQRSQNEGKNKRREEKNKSNNKKPSAAAEEAIDHLNKEAGRSYKHVYRADLEARIDEYNLTDVKAVISHKAKQWLADPDMSKYLRPETLFNRTKFESYCAESDGAAPPPSLLTPEQVKAGWVERDGKTAPPMPLIHRSGTTAQIDGERAAYYEWLNKYQWARGCFGSEVVDG